MVVTEGERAEALRQLRDTLKARKIKYADIALSSGNTPGWIGVVLRGGYPWRDANLLPKNIRLALEACGHQINALWQRQQAKTTETTGDEKAGA